MRFFPASPGQKEWAGQTTKRGQGAVAEGAKENGESISVEGHAQMRTESKRSPDPGARSKGALEMPKPKL